MLESFSHGATRKVGLHMIPSGPLIQTPSWLCHVVQARIFMLLELCYFVEFILFLSNSYPQLLTREVSELAIQGILLAPCSFMGLRQPISFNICS